MAGKRRKREIADQLTLSARLVRTSLSGRLAALDLYPGQDAALLAVGTDSDGVPLRELAERLAVKPPTVTKTVARLGREGLVEKRAAPDGTRGSVVALTQAGAAVLADIRRAREETEARLVEGLRAKDRRRLAKLLRRVARNMRADAATGNEGGPDEAA